MSIPTTVYSALVRSATLDALLARHNVNTAKPAIYEQWADQGAEMPYICLSYRFDEGIHWARRDTTIDIDIFVGAGDTLAAEKIRNEVINALDMRIFDDADEYKLRCYLASDQITAEDTPQVVHWNIEMLAIYWRTSFIKHLNP